jgi:hypothetical protein
MDLHQRLAEFFKRLEAAPPADSAQEALDLVCRLIEQVEDELCPVPRRDPPPLVSTGRMYAPKEDHVKRFAGGLIIADARHHRIYCRVDGGISIVRMTRKWESIAFEKPGKHERPH